MATRGADAFRTRTNGRVPVPLIDTGDAEPVLLEKVRIRLKVIGEDEGGVDGEGGGPAVRVHRLCPVCALFLSLPPDADRSCGRVKEEGGVPRITFLTLEGDESLFA